MATKQQRKIRNQNYNALYRLFRSQGQSAGESRHFAKVILSQPPSASGNDSMVHCANESGTAYHLQMRQL